MEGAEHTECIVQISVRSCTLRMEETGTLHCLVLTRLQCRGGISKADRQVTYITDCKREEKEEGGRER